MKLNQTTIGELYAALTPLEVKQLSAYLNEKPNDKVKILHQWMVKLTKENKLKDCDTDFLVQTILGKNAVYSSYTTLVNLLINHIKDYLILSKIHEKNIYTETLWGEILIERRLKRNLLLKVTNFKLDIYKDSYALMKKFFHDRERFYYEFIGLSKSNYRKMIDSLLEHNSSFKDFYDFYTMEQGNSLLTLAKQNNSDVLTEVDYFKKKSKTLLNSNNQLVRIQALMLSLIIDRNDEYYYDLVNVFKERLVCYSHEICIQLFPIILNYGISNINKGYEDFENYNYELFCFVNKHNILFKQGFFSVARLFTYIRLELRYGTIEKAEQLLEESLKVISPAQKESFQYLIESRIAFAKQDYKLALRKISIINPADSIYYYPQYKIMLIKCYIMLADIDRLMAERENFYKYIHGHKNIQEDEKRRHKLFIKYTEYLTIARYDYLTDYMKKRIEHALLQTSPYFTEKIWVRERWEGLKVSNS